MWTRLSLDHATLRSSIELAFSSRQTSLEQLDDFLVRPDWGQSRGGARKWRMLEAEKPEFLEVREIVRKAAREILG